jgi:divalent metal cation (Fe/Co/Zn/Cd) transporter
VVDVDSVGRRSAATAVRLEYSTIGWNVVEAAVAVGSGIVAGSVALVAFGLDSAIEVVSATVVLAHLRAVLAGAEPNAARQRWALRIIAFTFFALAAYMTVDAVLTVLRADRPSASPLGLLVTGAAVVVMPVLAWAKRRTAKELNAHGHQGSAVLVNADAAETLLCAVLSGATLVGVGANAVFGWWWADPLAGLVVVYFAIREGREAWEGELFDED